MPPPKPPAALGPPEEPGECVEPFPSCRACGPADLGPDAGSQAIRKSSCTCRLPSGTPSPHRLAWAGGWKMLKKSAEAKDSFKIVFMAGSLRCPAHYINKI